MNPISNYFGDWKKVINYKSLTKVLSQLDPLYAKSSICPHKNIVFKPFNLCPYSELKVVMIGANPYNIPDVSNGLLFGVNPDSKRTMPELEKLKEDIIDYSIPHYGINFDHSLESWAKQGCLLLNYGMTVETGSKSDHMYIWESFIISLLQGLTENNTGIIYVLFGDTASALRSHIGIFNYLFFEEHPKDILKNPSEYKYTVFDQINTLLKRNINKTINWYNEI